MGIPDDFPQMTIRVLEVAGITAPKCGLRFLDYLRARLSCLLHDTIDFFLAADVVTDRELSGTLRALANSCVMSNVASRPERELQA